MNSPGAKGVFLARILKFGNKVYARSAWGNPLAARRSFGGAGGAVRMRPGRCGGRLELCPDTSL